VRDLSGGRDVLSSALHEVRLERFDDVLYLFVPDEYVSF
jgi:hypothetical protein